MIGVVINGVTGVVICVELIYLVVIGVLSVKVYFLYSYFFNIWYPDVLVLLLLLLLVYELASILVRGLYIADDWPT